MGTQKIIGPDTNKNVIHNIYPDGLQLTPEQLNPHVGGWFKKCKHIYEYVNAPICPYCGRDTHEPDWEASQKIIRDHYESGENLKYIDPISGGTILGWWSI